MTYQIPQGIQVSLDGSTWHKLSDHNRNPINIAYTLIEQTDRMANGTLRKYVVARKFVITADWKDFPSIDSNVVDYKYSYSSITAISGNGTSITYTTDTPPTVGSTVMISGASVKEFNLIGTVTSATSTTFVVAGTKNATDTTAIAKYAASDNPHAAAWIKAFYEGNYGNPVYVKLLFANETAQKAGLPTGTYTDSANADSSNQVYTAFMTTFTYNVTKRRLGPVINGQPTGYDYVDLKIEFTEI